MNALDYIVNNGIYTFEQKPFNEVDNTLMCQLSYIEWQDIVGEKPLRLQEAAEKYFMRGEEGGVAKVGDSASDRLALSLMANNRRYRDLLVMDYVNDDDWTDEKQFGAITVQLGKNLYYIAFEGTDNMLFSWKEDFNMAYMTPVPSQKQALEYVSRQLKKRKGNFLLGGHSKGGNLAVYAAVELSSERIVRVYNNDGPGFSESYTAKPQYQAMLKRMITYLPSGSVIGTLMNSGIDRVIVSSEGKGPVRQHDFLSWQSEGGHFVKAENFSDFSRFINDSMNGWFRDLSFEEKIVFINTSYDAMVELGCSTIRDLEKKKADFLIRLVRKFMNYDRDTKGLMAQTLISLIKNSGMSFVNAFFLFRLNHAAQTGDRDEKPEEETEEE
ncbi:MAG: DUF2974 domain-containing protein [Erysipelotrichaceae bacterium]|nr:DUF2974 domain-containing protein [Erysipelotrichaceae bacterium]